jgi:PAS domain S-box-containing protein
MAENIQTRQLEVLFQVAQLITTLDLDEVLNETLNLTTGVVGATKGSFFLLDSDGKLQRFISARNIADTTKKQAVSHWVLEGGLAGWVLANGEGAIVNDTTQDERWITLDDLQRVRSALCVPFFVGGEARGVMTLEHPEPNHFKPEDLMLAKAVANQAGAALRNAQLFDRVEAQQQQLSAVMNSISEGLLAVDSMWHIKLVNPAAEAMLGVSADEAVGQRLDEVTTNPLFAQLVETIKEATLITQMYTFELRDDQTRKDYVVNVAPLQQESDGKAGYAIALYDVSSLKDLNRLKTHMIKMASHDLKGPLGLLVGYLDLMLTDMQAGMMPDRLYIDNIYKAITRMETLIASLLDAHRDEDSLQSKPIDPYELIQDIVEDMTPVAAQHNLTLVKNIRSNLHPIKGDFVQLREAVNNFVTNAFKYTPDGGTITINMYTEEDRFYFSVQDTGYGIPEDQQAYIFKPNFRASQPETAHIEGTGVGLSLVKEVVERHGGQVWFNSRKGEGSTFGFWVPMLDMGPI